MVSQVNKELSEITAEATIATVGSKITYAGGATGAVGALANINWIGWIGVFIAILGLAINFYFSWQRDKREKIESSLRVKNLMEGCSNEDK